MRAPEYHHHGNNLLFGSLLETGDTTCSTDKYDSTNGRWEDFPVPGVPIAASPTVRIVRPVAQITATLHANDD